MMHDRAPCNGDSSRQIASVAVFCGSRFGTNPAYAAAARATGEGLARAGIKLIYGGGKVGLMGVVADSAIAAGGQVSGIIPHFLSTREVMHESVDDLTVTDSMHSRKQHMFSQADAFLVLPGGLGTFDEAIEIITWRQLRLHDKPVLIANIEGWATRLIAAIEGAIADGFADASARGLFRVVPSVQAALAELTGPERPVLEKPVLEKPVSEKPALEKPVPEHLEAAARL